MAAQKFLALVAGRIKEITSIITSAGAGDEGKLVALDASGKLDASVLPTGIGANVIVLPASENLAANDLVNIWNDGGVAKVRKADATAEGKEVHGFVKAGVASPANASIYLSGNTITGLTGLTPGARQYLSTTPGLITSTAPSASGNVSQMVGIASNSTTIIFEPEEPISVA